MIKLALTQFDTRVLQFLQNMEILYEDDPAKTMSLNKSTLKNTKRLLGLLLTPTLQKLLIAYRKSDFSRTDTKVLKKLVEIKKSELFDDSIDEFGGLCAKLAQK